MVRKKKQEKSRKELKERTFVFLKPEAVMRGLIGEIISRIEKKGYNIVGMKLIWMNEEQAKKLYEVHKNKPFFNSLVSHVTSGPVVLMVIEGPNAVSGLRSMIGATDPLKAETGTIRGDYAIDIRSNVIHAADSIENAKREIEIFFNANEIFSYDKPTEEKYFFKSYKN
ncbi:MAG: nucleoside-diphosphate kinase [Candidatus Bathyarchaeia archaeon]